MARRIKEDPIKAEIEEYYEGENGEGLYYIALSGTEASREVDVEDQAYFEKLLASSRRTELFNSIELVEDMNSFIWIADDVELTIEDENTLELLLGHNPNEVFLSRKKGEIAILNTSDKKLYKGHQYFIFEQ